MEVILPDWAKRIHEDERSQRLYPFARSGQLTNELASHTYPEDFGSRPNSVGHISDASLAGTTDTNYGVILFPNLPLYRLSDADIALLHRWFPDGWNMTKLRAVLLTEFHRSPDELPRFDWSNILAILASRNPPQNRQQPTGDVPLEPANKQVLPATDAELSQEARILYACKLKTENSSLSVRDAARMARLNGHTTLFKSTLWKAVCHMHSTHIHHGSMGEDGKIEAESPPERDPLDE